MKKALLLFGLTVLIAITANAQKVIKTEALTVAAGGWKSMDVTYSDTSRLYGSFRAQGGGKNDIEVLIMDDENYENWSNGNQFSWYYFSGRVTVKTFDVTLAKGSYHLVFSNRWAVLTPKAVTVQFYEDNRK